MDRKTSCNNTDYTKGFKITKEPDGSFTAVRGKIKLRAASVAEINGQIKNLKE